MRHTKNIALLVLALCLSFVSMLNAAVVKGKIVDMQDMSLDYVNVVLISKTDKSDIYGSITDENGRFEIDKVPKGEYLLEVRFVGYKTEQRVVKVEDKEEFVKTGLIVLKEDSEILQEVEVVGQASQMRFEIDKKVFNVDQNLSAGGASASEMLQNIPSVDVDNDGNVSLRNNSSVEVWINGKPSGLTEDNRAQILEQMPAGSIESVEVITNPSAKYNPEGTAGIINLVLKKDRKAGYFGSVSGGGVYNIGSPHPGANVGLNFNYNSKIVDFYINFGTRYKNMKSLSYTDRYTFNRFEERTDTLSFMHERTDGTRGFLGIFGRAGADFRLSPKNTLSIAFMGHGGMSNMANINHYSIYNKINNDSILYDRSRTQQSMFPSYNVSLDYAYKIDKKGSEIRAGLEYSGHSRSGDYHYEQMPILGNMSEYTQIQRMNGRNNGAEFKFDYTQMFGKNMKLEAGLFGKWDKRFSPSRTWNLRSEGDSLLVQYNDFGYEEWIGAAYATYGAKFGPLSFSVGVRGEYTNTRVSTKEDEKKDFDVTNKGYWQVYPTAYLSYAFPKNHELQLNYTRRIERPRGRMINAFRNMGDSTNIQFGNPLLDPEISSSLELNYLKSWNNHALSASLYYVYTDNSISRVRYLDKNHVMNSTYENVAKEQYAGLEIVAKNKLAKWLNLTTTINAYYAGVDSVFYDINNDGALDLLYPSQNSFAFDAKLMANFMIPLGFSAQLTGQYSSPKVVAQGKDKGRYTIDVGVRKSFLDRKLNLALSVRDILNSKRWASETWGENFWQYSSFEPRGTEISLTLTYNFGNMKARRPKMNNTERKSRSEKMDSYMEEDML